MKKYNVQNYVRYKEDLKSSMPEDKSFEEHSRDELIIKFLPLVENIARKFATSQQASGVLSINDLIQEGSYGLIAAIDRLDWLKLSDSEDIEKTLKSFLSKRIKGAIRRAIDINRGDIKIPEHKLLEIRKNPEDEAKVAMFFNSVFSSIESASDAQDTPFLQIQDYSEPYNILLIQQYLLSIMKKYLTPLQCDVLRMSYGLDCDKVPAKEIAEKLNINVASGFVRVSQIKKEAIDKLIEKVPPEQVLDYV